jgi:hypothetical protein
MSPGLSQVSHWHWSGCMTSAQHRAGPAISGAPTMQCRWTHLPQSPAISSTYARRMPFSIGVRFGFGFRVQGSVFRVWFLVFRVQSSKRSSTHAVPLDTPPPKSSYFVDIRLSNALNIQVLSSVFIVAAQINKKGWSLIFWSGFHHYQKHCSGFRVQCLIQ